MVEVRRGCKRLAKSSKLTSAKWWTPSKMSIAIAVGAVSMRPQIGQVIGHPCRFRVGIPLRARPKSFRRSAVAVAAAYMDLTSGAGEVLAAKLTGISNLGLRPEITLAGLTVMGWSAVVRPRRRLSQARVGGSLNQCTGRESAQLFMPQSPAGLTDERSSHLRVSAGLFLSAY